MKAIMMLNLSELRLQKEVLFVTEKPDSYESYSKMKDKLGICNDCFTTLNIEKRVTCDSSLGYLELTIQDVEVV